MTNPVHDALDKAVFVVSCHGDGAGAYLVYGWEAMCKAVVAEHFDGPDEEQEDEIMRRLEDPDDWADGFDGVPFHWWIRHEDGSVEVHRITHNPPRGA